MSIVLNAAISIQLWYKYECFSYGFDMLLCQQVLIQSLILVSQTLVFADRLVIPKINMDKNDPENTPPIEMPI